MCFVLWTWNTFNWKIPRNLFWLCFMKYAILTPWYLLSWHEMEIYILNACYRSLLWIFNLCIWFNLFYFIYCFWAYIVKLKCHNWTFQWADFSYHLLHLNPSLKTPTSQNKSNTCIEPNYHTIFCQFSLIHYTRINKFTLHQNTN